MDIAIECLFGSPLFKLAGALWVLFALSPCVCMGFFWVLQYLCTVQRHAGNRRRIVSSKFPIGGNVYFGLSVCVGPVIDWQHVQGGSWLSNSACWDGSANDFWHVVLFITLDTSNLHHRLQWSVNLKSQRIVLSFICHVDTSHSVLFSLNRCVTWRSLRRVDIRPCRGCATSPKMEVGYEFTNTCAECPYVQALGNSWAMQCNVVGTSLELIQFYEKGIHCRTWGNVATSCEMWESEFFFYIKLPWSSTRDYQGCTCWSFC